MQKVIVIGGGASGIIAALKASQKNEVIIVDENKALAKKILVTGNGRSNFWNAEIDETKYYTSNRDFLKNILKRKEDVYTYLTCNLGITPQNKNGYIYPYSNTAASIQKTFIDEVAKRNIKVINNLVVEDIEVGDDITVIFNDASKISADRVIIATGSLAGNASNTANNLFAILKKWGIEVTKLKPALVPLKAEGNFLKDWENTRSNAKISIYKDNKVICEETGEIQLTNYGISGIVTFNVSSLVQDLLEDNDPVTIYLDFLPDISDIESFLDEKNKNMYNATLEEILETIFNYKLNNVFYKLSGLKKDELYCNIKNKSSLFNLIKHFPLKITGTLDFDHAQVCHGGVSLEEINLDFHLKKEPRISLVGEILDVDGICGGYNLAFAFISGYIAGESLND